MAYSRLERFIIHVFFNSALTVVIFVAVEDFKSGLGDSSAAILGFIRGFKTYFVGLIDEVEFYVVGGFNDVKTAIVADLDNVGPLLGYSLLGTFNAAGVRGWLVGIRPVGESVNTVAPLMSNCSDEIDSMANKSRALSLFMEEFRNDTNAWFAGSPGCGCAAALDPCDTVCAAQRTNILAEVAKLTIDADLTGTDISEEKGTLNDLVAANLTGTIDNATNTYDSLPQTITDTAASTLDTVNASLDEISASVNGLMQPLKNGSFSTFLDAFDSLDNSTEVIRETLNNPDTATYIANAGLILMILFMFTPIFSVFGAALGFFGFKSNVPPDQRQGLGTIGGFLLML